MCECGFETTGCKIFKKFKIWIILERKKIVVKALNLATFYLTHKISRLYLNEIGLADHCKTESKTFVNRWRVKIMICK